MKKTVSIILALCMAVSLTACGGKTQEKNRRRIQAGAGYRNKLQHHRCRKL